MFASKILHLHLVILAAEPLEELLMYWLLYWFKNTASTEQQHLSSFFVLFLDTFSQI